VYADFERSWETNSTRCLKLELENNFRLVVAEQLNMSSFILGYRSRCLGAVIQKGIDYTND